MHEIYELKEMLMKELEEYGRKQDMSTGSLEVVDKLAHTIKNLCKIIEDAEEEEGYSERGSSYRGGSYARQGGGRGGQGGGNRGGGSSRGGRSNRSYRSYEGGSYAQRRDRMGRYSGEAEEMVEQLRELMEEAPDEVRMDMEKLIRKVEQM